MGDDRTRGAGTPERALLFVLCFAASFAFSACSSCGTGSGTGGSGTGAGAAGTGAGGAGGGNPGTGSGGHGGASPVDGGGGQGGAVMTPPFDAGDLTSLIAAMEAAQAAAIAGATQIDMLGEGRLDWTRTFDSSGNLTGEQIDVTGDGGTLLTWDYTQPTQTFVSSNAGFVDETVSATPQAGSQAVAYVVTSFSPDPTFYDEQLSFTVDPASDTMDTTLSQDIHDGNGFQLVGTNTGPRDQWGGSMVTVPTSGPDQCSTSMASQIIASANFATSHGAKCLDDIDPALAKELAQALESAPVRIQCSPTSSPLTGPSGTICADTQISARIITLYPEAFLGPPTCLGFDETIFHEMMHLMPQNTHADNATQQSDPGDRIWGCMRTCFEGNATSVDCAQCIRAKNGDSRCADKDWITPIDCSAAPQSFICVCGALHFYSDEASCVAACSALPCFGAGDICGPASAVRGPCRN
jgi:hypothetical protein